MSIDSFASADGDLGDGSLALSLGSFGAIPAPTSGADTAFRQFGLSMRFTVVFSSGDGVDLLGEWSSCKGLKVDFKTEEVKRGGFYNGEVKLPTQVVYSPVVLERAMEPGPSHQLQGWLGRLVDNWVNYSGTGPAPTPQGTVQITLQDVYQKTVASWTLINAFPVSWSGPTLDAKQNAIALETLTLEHQGFLPPAH